MGFPSVLFALAALASPAEAPPAELSARVVLEDPEGVLDFVGQPHPADGRLEMEVAPSGDAGRMRLRIETDLNVVEIDVAQPVAGGVKLTRAKDGTFGSVELWGLGVVRLNGVVAASAAKVVAKVDVASGAGLRVVVVGLPGRIFPGGSIEARFAHVEILGGGQDAGDGEPAPTRIQTPWGQAWVEPETPEERPAPADGGQPAL